MAFNAYEIVHPSLVLPQTLLQISQRSGAFETLAGGKQLTMLSSTDQYVYIKTLQMRGAANVGQAAANQLDGPAFVTKMIQTPTYLIRARAQYDHHDTAAAGNWDVALPEAYRRAMWQTFAQNERSALLYGFQPANGEGLLNANGATAVTLVPAMAPTAGHVTMLQRSPTYIATLPGRDPLADVLRKVLPAKIAHTISRWKNVLFTTAFYQFCRRWPKAARRVMGKMVAAQLPRGYDLDPDFNPRYDPWDQRLCLVPDGDLFRAIKQGTADIVTDTIERFTPTGIDLASGRHLDADVIVSATGLNLQAGGGMAVSVDGRAVDLGDTFVYKGFMLSDVPNLAMCVGYTNASWTLRADISSQEVCKVINHLDRYGYRSATPTIRDAIDRVPILDLSSGYVQRGKDVMPQQGTKAPWVLRQNYLLDLASAKFGDVTEGLVFDRPAERAPAADRPRALSSP